MDRDDLYVRKTRQKAESKNELAHFYRLYIYHHYVSNKLKFVQKNYHLGLTIYASFFLPYRSSLSTVHVLLGAYATRRRRQVKTNLHFTSEIRDSLDLFGTPMALKNEKLAAVVRVPYMTQKDDKEMYKKL